MLLGIENLLVGLLGRPVLLLLKWLRWPLLGGGLILNAVWTYHPVTHATTFEGYTFLPGVLGLVLFAVGCTVKRYDEAYHELADINTVAAGEMSAHDYTTKWSP